MNESNDNLSVNNFISELDKKRRRERSIRFKIGEVMNDISEMSELPHKQIEVQNRITELNELKEHYTCLNIEIIDLLPDDQVEIECQVSLCIARKFVISLTRDRDILQNVLRQHYLILVQDIGHH